MGIDFQNTEKKWQAKWENAALFKSDVNAEKEKKYITAAFPYPNSPQHIGHARTYTTTDAYARYLRLCGFNVLFPMAFHVTGTPILAMARRIAEGDEEIFSIFENIYGIPRERTKTLSEPEALVMHFSKEIEQGMHEMGYSIDWRRKFYTMDKKFSRFIQWQFRKLKELGYLVQGTHAIAFCPKDKQAVGAHDTKGDADPEIEEFIAIKFAFEDGFIPAATLRPETIYGVTALWVNPQSTIVKANVSGEVLFATKEATAKLSMQGKEVKILKEFPAKTLLGKKCRNPETDEDVEILPANFVDAAHATGMVMSVPAHAPYDFLAIRDHAPKGYEKYLKQVLKISDYGNFPAKEICESLGIASQNDKRAEEATKEIYKKEAHTGEMILGRYKGMRALEAKDRIKHDLIAAKKAFVLYEMGAQVFCRCGTKVVATVLQNQWFIDYSKEEWKEKARECLENMAIVPEKIRQEYNYAIGWFKQKACARSQGLGTRFPFDEKLVIEALSDSTIYMAYYTVAHLLEDFREDELTEEFFDYVLLGRGTGKGTQNTTHNAPNKKLARLRESFLYWYPLDSRHSGADLVRNHLPFFIFNHVGIFPKELWPKQIATNGFVLMEGKKMSKSLANILPLRKAIAEYGADVIRFSVVSGADLAQDSDFNRSVAEGTRNRLEFISSLIEKATHEKPDKHRKRVDKWLVSRLNRKIKKANELYPLLRLRELALEIFYDFTNDLHWYLERSNNDEKELRLKEVLKAWCILINPFMPHISEEFYSKLGGKGFASDTAFPVAEDELMNEKAEKEEEYVKAVLEDVEKISSLVIKDAKTQKLSGAHVFVAARWKKKLYDIIRAEKAFDRVMKACSQDGELKVKMPAVERITKQLIKNAYALPQAVAQEDELDALNEAKQFLEAKLKCKISIAKEEDSKDAKSAIALPGKPAIKLVIADL